MGLGDWFDKVTDKIEAKGNQFIKKTGENIADTGRNFADTIAPRAPLAPEKRSAYLAKSRKETGANRYDPAANLSDAVLIEKRWSAQEKVRRHFGKTAGSGGVALLAVKTLQPDHAITQGYGTAKNGANTVNSLVREEVYVREFNRRGIDESTCNRRPQSGMVRRGLWEGTVGQLKSTARGEAFSLAEHEVLQNFTPTSNTPVVPVYQTPRKPPPTLICFC